MRRNNKQVTTYFILFSLLLIGVIYAILQANLQINGTAKIQANTWDIHFDNIQINENSVSVGENDSAATIDPENNCKVDFEVTLSIPGDFYEFTIDVVNAGTIDGMIGTLNKTLKVNNEVVSEVPNYLDYSVTYSDGVEIEENHKIDAGTTETYLVRLEFKTDIEELPEAATITTSLEPQYLQADTNAIDKPQLLYDVLKTETAKSNKGAYEYTNEHKDSFTTNGTKKIYYWSVGSYENQASTKTTYILNKWNVIFGGFCWQMFRTTDTGGVKLLYNGVPEEGKCISTGVNQEIGKSKFNEDYHTPASAGYMYNPNSIVEHSSGIVPGANLFGSGIVYENGRYYLTDTTNTYDKYHHYNCVNENTSCTSVWYYYYDKHKVILSNGKDITQSLKDMLSGDDVNQTNSAIKTTIDTWYQNNLTSFTNKLEDIIYCNNRRISEYGGWNPNGGDIKTYLQFDNYSNILICPNITDQFSMSNNKAQLTYPIGLMTANEASLLQHRSLIGTNSYYWLSNGYNFDNMIVRNYSISSSGGIRGDNSDANYGIRPVVSLKPGTTYSQGDGSKDNPYIIN